jgi:uncharacterized membrane protein YpjA
MKTWSVNLATWIGLSSILIWASLVAVVKLITESTSAVQGVALIYSFSSLAILAFTGFPNIRQMSKRYLLGCGALMEDIITRKTVNIGTTANRVV